MLKNLETVRVAVIQASPVLFDKQATVNKACRLLADAASQAATLVVFPEAYIPAYPRGLGFGMVVGSRTDEGRVLWQRYWEGAIAVPGPETAQLGEAAKTAGVYMAIGVIERDDSFSGGTLYCTVLYFGPDGALLGKHRKLKPTGSERLIWGEGDGSTLTVLDTEIGKIGGLICWENYMPLARVAMYGKGVEIYIAPTADSRDAWQSTMQHIALEGRCFVLGCNQHVMKSMYPEDIRNSPEMEPQPEEMCRGGSVIISPMGEVLAGPLFDEEGMLIADLDMSMLVRAKLDFDAVGHYSRPDVFELRVNVNPREPVRYVAQTDIGMTK